MSHRVRMLTSADVTEPEDVAGVQLTVILDYDPADALAVSLTFCGAGGTIAWVISRDLLRDGLYETSGEEEVSVWPATLDFLGYHLYLRLRNELCSMVFRFPLRVIDEFLAKTYSSVPAGTEIQSADLDAELEIILADVA